MSSTIPQPTPQYPQTVLTCAATLFTTPMTLSEGGFAAVNLLCGRRYPALTNGGRRL